MPRTARVLLPNTAHHVVQRGHNRASVFASTEDYQCYLETLGEWKVNLGIKVYAYCLMTNHVHLVVEPGDDVTVLSQLMRRLAGRQTRYVNKLEGRTGTLWNGRYKASPIQSSRYLLACTRYVELNPLRARMVCRAENYPWSSYRQKVGDRPWEWLDEDYCYTALGASITERRKRYAEFTMQVVSEDEQVFLADAVRRNQLTGDHRFIDEVERRIGIRVERRGQGRPVKNGLSDSRSRGRNNPAKK